MRLDILEYLQKEIYSRCQQPSNKFGMGCYYIHGAEIAKELLERMSYDENKIILVQECIRNHRGSINLDKFSKEELCVADADAISHFYSVPSLLYLACLSEEEMEQFAVEDGVLLFFEKVLAGSEE